MARTTIDKRRIPTVIADVRDLNHPTSIALEGGDPKKRLDPIAVEKILLMVACGRTQKDAAITLGINPGAVAQRRIDDPNGFGARMREAKAIGADTLADSVLEYAQRLDLSAKDREIMIDALKWTAKMQNRGMYGDKIAVDARQVVINLPPELDGI